MRDWKRFGGVGLMVLGLCVAACGSKEPAAGSGSAAPKASAASSVATKTSAAPADSAKPTADNKHVDIDAILKSAESSGKKGALKVDLSKIDDKDAPSLGGGGGDKKDAPPEEKTPEPPPGKQLEWLKAGPVEVPNPGWTKKSLENGNGGILTSPDDKVFLVFTEFSDNADGQAKVEQFKKNVELQDMEWTDPAVVKLGPDGFPCAIGAGSGKDEHGVKIELIYALIDTGTEGHNILIIGGAQEDAGKEHQDDAEQILLNIRKPQAQ